MATILFTVVGQEADPEDDSDPADGLASEVMG
jgi:hypothetical protein